MRRINCFSHLAFSNHIMKIVYLLCMLALTSPAHAFFPWEDDIYDYELPVNVEEYYKKDKKPMDVIRKLPREEGKRVAKYMLNKYESGGFEEPMTIGEVLEVAPKDTRKLSDMLYEGARKGWISTNSPCPDVMKRLGQCDE